MTGKQKFKLANAALGAIVTHALVNSDGTYIVASESGNCNPGIKRDKTMADKLMNISNDDTKITISG